ncbi:MAG: hypothetical protein WBX15_03755 [Thermoanaerobaculia bacterium]
MKRLAILALLFPLSVFGQEMERVLIPVFTPTPIDGAYGSEWTTDLAMLNQGSQPILIDGYDQLCHIECGPTQPTPPGRTFYPSSLLRNALHGVFLWVSPPSATRDVAIQLRGRDLSRQSEDWGTEIPTVRESAAPIGTFSILDVPSTPGYRVMLRIYQFADVPLEVGVQFFALNPAQRVPIGDVNPDPLIAEEVLTLPAGNRLVPGYAELPDLAGRHPELATVERYRILVEAIDATPRLWGMVTLTNNATQHITVLSPRVE